MKKLAAVLLGLAVSFGAQAFPTKPIKVVIAFPPGAAHDTLGRILASEFGKGFAPGSIAENKPGGGTVIATDYVAKSAPDGHTILMVGFPFPLINSMFPNSGLDVTRDFKAVINVMSSPNALISRADLPYKSLAEVIAAAKASPGKITYASVGNGSSPHMGMELLKKIAGVDILNVPYKGSAPARTAMLGGEVDIMFDNLPNVVPMVKGGRMRALAVTSPQRSRLLPEAPTMAEAGVANYVMDIWFGVAVPAATPPQAIAALNKEINRIIATPEVKARLEGMGLDIIGGSAESFQKRIADDVAKWSGVVRDAGIKPQ
ncbi:MAG TPA: tripartite tricarboxylate transporter substrate binding protein [Burkholderiales bacterium]|nr:tripartite tricarboxylate transporter substrate binding protein [Burkholderiales bacterium]